MLGGGGGGSGITANEYSCAHGAQINFGDLAPYLTSASYRHMFNGSPFNDDINVGLLFLISPCLLSPRLANGLAAHIASKKGPVKF
jgi:hypothetical protein